MSRCAQIPILCLTPGMRKVKLTALVRKMIGQENDKFSGRNNKKTHIENDQENDRGI